MDYGLDISAFPDLSPTLAFVRGPRLVLEDIAKRLLTPAGFFSKDPAYGYDVRAQLNGNTTDAAMALAIEHQAMLDERVYQASCGIVRTGDAVRFKLQVVLYDDDRTFALVVDITRAGDVVVGINA